MESAGRGEGIEDLLAGHLERELGDPDLARRLARLLLEDALSWQAPSLPLARIGTIMAFTFGNRMQPNGNRVPGPVNAALADLAVRLHEATGAPVWAQWEVAEAIGERIPEDRLRAIYPPRDAQGEPRYLSTGGVIDAILADGAQGPERLGGIGVVAMRDHAWRCVAICRRRGLEAGVPQGFALPEFYDEESGQAWTRDRLPYLLHDLHCRALDRRDALIAEGSR